MNANAMNGTTTNDSARDDDNTTPVAGESVASPSRRRAALGLLALALSLPAAACAAPARRPLRRRVRRRVRRRARFVTRRGRRLLLLAAVPTVGAVLTLDDGREALVREVGDEMLTVDIEGSVESVAFEVER